jgi:type IV pilus assembly protein PilY1
VTTEPRLATVNIGGAYKRFVYVATGRYLGDTDVPISASETLPGSQTQTIYGLVDDLTNPSGITPVITDNLRSSLQGQTFVRDPGNPLAIPPVLPSATVTTTAVNYTTKKGWYIDLADTGTTPSERVNTNPALVSGALILTANTPSSDACLPGGSSWLYVLDYTTGGALTTSTTGLAGIKLGDALASRPVVILLPSGAIKVLVRTSDSKTLTPETGIPVKALKAPKRAATREILK